MPDARTQDDRLSSLGRATRAGAVEPGAPTKRTAHSDRNKNRPTQPPPIRARWQPARLSAANRAKPLGLPLLLRITPTFIQRITHCLNRFVADT